MSAPVGEGGSSSEQVSSLGQQMPLLGDQAGGGGGGGQGQGPVELGSKHHGNGHKGHLLLPCGQND